MDKTTGSCEWTTRSKTLDKHPYVVGAKFIPKIGGGLLCEAGYTVKTAGGIPNERYLFKKFLKKKTLFNLEV